MDRACEATCAVVLTLLVLLGGVGTACSRAVSPPLAQARGIVTRGGKPLANIRLSFIAEEPAAEGSPGVVTTDESGVYAIGGTHESPGLQPGTYRIVAIDNEAGPQGAGDEIRPQVVAARFANRYADPLRTPLRATLVAGSQDLNLALD